MYSLFLANEKTEQAKMIKENTCLNIAVFLVQSYLPHQKHGGTGTLSSTQNYKIWPKVLFVFFQFKETQDY